MKNEKAPRITKELFYNPLAQKKRLAASTSPVVGSDLLEKMPAAEHELDNMLSQNTGPRLTAVRRGPGQQLRQWFSNNTFTPPWLPSGLAHPFFGYLVAILLQAATVFLTFYVDNLLHDFVFVGSPEVLALALVAVSWGVGPSIVATLVGASMLLYIVLPSHPGWNFHDSRDLYEVLLFILIGLVISIVASQTERARRRGERLAESLTKEHARLEGIIETVPDIVEIYDKRGRIIQINDIGRHSAIFGPDMPNKSLGELVKTREAFTLTGKRVGETDLPIMHALHGETVENMEIRVFDSQGTEHFLSISAAPLRNLHGKTEGVVSITRDLSDLHQSEREAANRAIELEALFESLTDGIFVVNRAGEVIRSNGAFQEILGLTEENQQSFEALPLTERYAMLKARDEHGTPLTYEQWPERRILRGEVLKGSNTIDIHFQNLHGQEFQLNIGGTPLYDREGDLIAALCVCHDVTERRKLEKKTHNALEALVAMAQTLVISSTDSPPEDDSPIGSSKNLALRMALLANRVLDSQRVSIFLTDMTTGLLHGAAVVGLPASTQSRWWQTIDQIVLDLHNDSVREIVTQLQKGQTLLIDMQTDPFKTWLQDISHSHSAVVAPMNVGGQLIGLLAVGQKSATHAFTSEESKLTGAIAQLLALVFERERLLDERARAQSTELALRTANKRMEDFLGMVSHELKTPLTSIKGNTQLAIRQLRNSMQAIERVLGMYESAEQQSRRLNRLVDDLLDVSRTQAGQLEIIAGPCDLREIMHEALQELRKIWPERSIELEMEEEIALPLEADADRVGQVITNYVTNALKYSDANSLVSIETRREARQIYVGVRDQGPGLSEAQQELIWDRFQRVPGIEVRSSAHTSQTGLGLGLYISKNIIQSQDGEVGVESTPGTGSIFWFRLPLYPAKVNEQSEQKHT